MNPILNIAVPFIGMSFLMQKIKNKDSIFFSKFLAIALFLGSAITYFTNKDLLIECSIFNLSITLAYLSIVIKHNFVQKSLKFLAVLPILYISYINGLHYVFIVSQAMFLIVLYYAVNNLKSNVTIFALQIPAMLIAGIYLSNSMQLFTISAMLLLGSIRYFIESKTKQAPSFLSLAYILIVGLLISSFNSVNFNYNMFVVFAASILPIVLYCIQSLSKNKLSITERINKTSEIMLVTYIKIFLFNIIVVALAYLANIHLISIWFAIAFAIIALVISFARIFYLEHLAKSRYYKK